MVITTPSLNAIYESYVCERTRTGSKFLIFVRKNFFFPVKKILILIQNINFPNNRISYSCPIFYLNTTFSNKKRKSLCNALLEKCTYPEFSWFVFSLIRTRTNPNMDTFHAVMVASVQDSKHQLLVYNPNHWIYHNL